MYSNDLRCFWRRHIPASEARIRAMASLYTRETNPEYSWEMTCYGLLTMTNEEVQRFGDYCAELRNTKKVQLV